MRNKREINLRDLKARIGIYKRAKFASKEKTLVTKGDLYPCELLAQRMSTVATTIISSNANVYKRVKNHGRLQRKSEDRSALKKLSKRVSK